MVYQCGHWVAVRGVRTDVAPAPGATYVIQGFYINNPWPPTPSFYNPALAPPPPHSDPDACGSGGNRGVVDEYVTYSEWQSTYHTGCDVYGVGHVQFISVCDPRRPPIGTLRLAGQVRLAQGERIIAAKKALELAERGLEEHGLAAEGALAKSLSKARASEAQLVQRLDRPDDFYYLVTLRRGKTATAVARIDALHGTFQGVHALSGARLSPIIDREGALQRLSQPHRSGGWPRADSAPRSAFCLYPTLVWRPCRESRSPYYPFHRSPSGARSSISAMTAGSIRRCTISAAADARAELSKR